MATNRKSLWLLCLAATFCVGEMPDCTAFGVGKKASATGRVVVGHNNDGAGDVVSPAIAAKGAGFDFTAAYQGLRTIADPPQRYRRADFCRVAAGVDADHGNETWEVRPRHLVSVDDIKRGFSIHYESTSHEAKGLHPEEVCGVIWPICRLKTLESVICEFSDAAAETRVLLARVRPAACRGDAL